MSLFRMRNRRLQKVDFSKGTWSVSSQTRLWTSEPHRTLLGGGGWGTGAEMLGGWARGEEE